MASVSEFYNDPDWEGSSGPIIPRTADASEDLWPNGTGAMGEIDGGDKDVLADGLHPVLAIGPKAQRPRNLTGVVISYNEDAEIAQVNLAEKVCVKNWVANVLTYSGASPKTFVREILLFLAPNKIWRVILELTGRKRNLLIEGGA